MQMLLSDWLSRCPLSAIGVQWLLLVDKTAAFSRFSEVLKGHLETNSDIPQKS